MKISHVYGADIFILSKTIQYHAVFYFGCKPCTSELSLDAFCSSLYQNFYIKTEK